ncbi:MAG: hypothetical protein KAJ86_07990 [Alphaproteobacteria bacterium]|nr:hypothetical protein [Alphaproteobacteria bacterium]
MQVSISKAHKMTGVARSTIYKDIDEGKLSCTTSARGKKTIMVSELQRVYGDIKLDNQDKTEPKNKVSSNVVSEKKRTQTTNSSNTNQIAVLQERIESLTLRMQNKEEFIEDLKEERRKNRSMFEEQVDNLKEALGKAQDGYNQVTKLLEHNPIENDNNDWKKSIKALEDRIANQEKTAEEKSKKETKEKEDLQAKLKEKEKTMKEQQEALELEKSKSFLHKLFGK